MKRRLFIKSIGQQIPGARCPRCGGNAGGGTAISTDAQTEPQAGDIALCLYCGSFNRYNADLTQREMTAAELRELERDPGMAQLAEIAARFSMKWRKENP
jgi:hypothetical protein